VTSQSGVVSPSPTPLTGSLLLTLTMLQLLPESQAPVRSTLTDFGGPRTPGVALSVPMCGATLSITVTFTVSAQSRRLSVTRASR